jgi:hypothetical protein
LLKYTESVFAKNLYEITKDINPIGKGKFLKIDRPVIGKNIYNNRKNPMYDISTDSKYPTNEEKKKRQELESFFVYGRRSIPFGKYSTFLDQLPKLSNIRKNTIGQLKQYVKTYC